MIFELPVEHFPAQQTSANYKKPERSRTTRFTLTPSQEMSAAMSSSTPSVRRAHLFPPNDMPALKRAVTAPIIKVPSFISQMAPVITDRRQSFSIVDQLRQRLASFVSLPQLA